MTNMPDGSAGDSPAKDRSPSESSRDLEAGRVEEVPDHHSVSSSESESTTNDGRIARISTNVSLGPDNPVDHYTSFVEIPDSVYERFPRHRKIVIVALLSYCAFLSPISSTTVLSATPEVAAEYHTTGSIVDISNALYMLFMGISPIVWGPLSEVWGRKIVTCTTALLFFGCSVGSALAPNLAAFFIFRILTAFEGTAFLLVGSACLQDIYRPTERATALGWFLSGTLIGPAIGPFLGGIIVTYTSWRVIFWLQAGLSGVATLGTLVLLPETIHHKKIDDLAGLGSTKKAAVFWHMINPTRVIRLFKRPNVLIVGLAASALTWNMYSLLAPIRYVLNPRFHLTSPMQSGLFYLAPGGGYLLGTFMGGRYADYTVRRYIRLRGGVRVPEDRMRSALPFMGVVIPACMLVYGWGVAEAVGGIPLAVIMLFLQGVAQLFCFPSLNTYCLDVMQDRGADVIAGNYFIRYLFACLGVAVVLPAVETIGVGWFSTISAAFLVATSLGTWATIIWGKQWRERIDAKKRAKRLAREKAQGQGRGQGGQGHRHGHGHGHEHERESDQDRSNGVRDQQQKRQQRQPQVDPEKERDCEITTKKAPKKEASSTSESRNSDLGAGQEKIA